MGSFSDYKHLQENKHYFIKAKPLSGKECTYSYYRFIGRFIKNETWGLSSVSKPEKFLSDYFVLVFEHDCIAPDGDYMKNSDGSIKRNRIELEECLYDFEFELDE